MHKGACYPGADWGEFDKYALFRIGVKEGKRNLETLLLVLRAKVQSEFVPYKENNPSKAELVWSEKCKAQQGSNPGPVCGDGGMQTDAACEFILVTGEDPLGLHAFFSWSAIHLAPAGIWRCECYSRTQAFWLYF